MCDEVVCDKVVCVCDMEAAEAGDEDGGCRSKNKNPTQFCGEKEGRMSEQETRLGSRLDTPNL